MLEQSRNLKLLTWFYFLVGLVLLIPHASFLVQPWPEKLLLLFLAAGITTYLSVLNLGVTFNLVSGLDFICLYFWGTPALIWLGIVEVIIDNFSRRDGWLKLFFNLGQTVIYLSATGSVINYLNQQIHLPLELNFIIYYLLSTILNALLFLPLLYLRRQYHISLLHNISTTMFFSIPFYYLIFASYQTSPLTTLVLVPAFLYLIKKLLQPTLPTTPPEVLDNHVLLYSRKHLFYALSQIAQKKRPQQWVTLVELPDYRDIEEMQGSMSADKVMQELVRQLHNTNDRLTVYRYTSNQLAVLGPAPLTKAEFQHPLLSSHLYYDPALISGEELLDQLEQQLREQRKAYQEEKENQLQQSIRLATIGQLAAGIAHEIRNPLTTVSGFLQLLEWGRDLPPETVKIMEEELDRVNQLVTGLLYLSNPTLEHKQREKLSLNGLVQSAVELIRPELMLREIELKMELDPELPELYLNSAQIRQLLINLLQNSCLAVDSKGWIKIVTIQVDDQVLLKIQDSGPGVAPDMREQIFQPFYTTRSNAIGLGLTICQHIASNHHGTLYLESDSEFTTFILRLPLFLNLVG